MYYGTTNMVIFFKTPKVHVKSQIAHSSVK
jgi:hypothetical protein